MIFDQDEFPRHGTTAAGLGKLRPAFDREGTVTAGNASGINDGAGAVVVASAEAVALHGLNPMGRVRSMAVAGVPPRIMGIGPVPATRKLLERTGTTLDEIGVIELNEAFAAQALAALRMLGLPDDAEHVNPNGGAIALGHPLGALRLEVFDVAGRRHLAKVAHDMLGRMGERLVEIIAVIVIGGQIVCLAGDDVESNAIELVHQRRGVGSRLLEQALADFRAAGYQGVQAGCEDFNRAACGFFERRGWQVIGSEPQRLAPGLTIDALVYSRRLDPVGVA